MSEKRYVITVRSSRVTVEARVYVNAESLEEAVQQVRDRIEDSDDDFSDLEWEPQSLDEIDIYEIRTPDGKHLFASEIKETK